MGVNRALALIRLARPHFLPAAAVPYLIGALMARAETGALNVAALVGGLAVVWAVQLFSHFINEYYDQETDRLNRRRTLLNGGSGVLPQGKLRAEAALLAGGVALTLAAGLFAALRWLPTFSLATGGIFALALVGASGYSAPPLALARRGLGEVDTAVIGALLVPLFGYNLQTGGISMTLILACLPFGLLVMANMINVHLPDYEADRQAGKHTLVVILGRRAAVRLYTILLIAGYLSPWLTLGWGLPLPVLVAGTATAPLGILHLRLLYGGGDESPERTARVTALGAGAVLAVGAAELLGFLIFTP